MRYFGVVLLTINIYVSMTGNHTAKVSLSILKSGDPSNSIFRYSCECSFTYSIYLELSIISS